MIETYSPKINEDLIPILYRAAKREGIPMTRLVSNIIREALETDYSVNQADEKLIDARSASSARQPINTERRILQ